MGAARTILKSERVAVALKERRLVAQIGLKMLQNIPITFCATDAVDLGCSADEVTTGRVVVAGRL